MGLKFVEDLGFKSTNDRLFIPLLKAMKFLDESGKPTSRYHAFLDDSEWKRMLADGIRDAYPDLFRINKNAQSLSREQLTGKLKSLGEGKLSQAVLTNTAKTFVELVKLADFSKSEVQDTPLKAEEGVSTPEQSDLSGNAIVSERKGQQETSGSPTMVYRIEIVLPAVRDQAVYDAIFRSAKEHLFR